MRQVKELWFTAVKNGRQSEVMALLERENLILEQEDFEHAFCLAAQNDRSETAKWLLDYKKIASTTLIAALNDSAGNGHYSFMCWLILELKVVPTADTVCAAAKGGHLDIVKWLAFNPYFPIDNDIQLALCAAAEFGHDQIVKLLLTHKKVNPAYSQNLAFRTAATKGHLEVIKILLTDKRVDPADLDNEAIYFASLNGRYKITKLLLTDARVDPSHPDQRSLQGAIHQGHIEIVKLLLADNRIDLASLKLDYNASFSFGESEHHPEIFELLLKNPKTDLSYLNYYAFIVAACIGSLQFIKKLLADPRVKPNSHSKNLALCESARLGYYDVVEFLLAFNDIELKWNGYYGFVRAIENNHLNVVKLLLADERINQIRSGKLFTHARNYVISPSLAKIEHFEMTKLLRLDKRMKRKDKKFLSEEIVSDRALLIGAAKNGNDKLIQLLLVNELEYMDVLTYAIRAALQKNYLQTVKLLLADKRIDPLFCLFDDDGSNKYSLLALAAKEGSLEMIQLFLADKRFDPAINNYDAIIEAALHDHIQVLRLLISDSRVDKKKMSEIIEGHNQKETIRAAIKEANAFINSWDKFRLFIFSPPHQLHPEITSNIQKKVYGVFMK